MSDSRLTVLVIGAHPDDCDIKAGGVAALYRQAGHRVRFVSVTNGESGHHLLHGPELVAIRRQEAAAAAEALGGIEYDVLSNRDGYLEPTLAARAELIGLIRQTAPDLILTHRPNDYHPDHRYTSQLVCDSAYMVTVPAVVPEVPVLRTNPVIAWMSDGFQKPAPFNPTVAVDIGPVLEQVIDALDCHRSQFYEWLAWNHQYEDQLPADDAGRREWLGGWFRKRIGGLADRYRPLLHELYGRERGEEIQWVEAFEPCEYGSPLTEENRRKLFPFLPPV
ncbi:MAG: PIG-L family deacetylase [Planctomycetaceae bacterium]|nr:PIG-L family deacetylase [Planctomycetaceae bacterium]